MPASSTFYCDCCDTEMPDVALITCVMVTMLDGIGNAVQHYFCLANGCGGAVADFLAGLPDVHADHAPE